MLTSFSGLIKTCTASPLPSLSVESWKASWQWRVKTFDSVTWSSKEMWGLEVDKLGFNCHWTRWPCRGVSYLPEPHCLSWKLGSILIVLGKRHIKFLSGRKYFSSVSTGKFPVRMEKWSSWKWLSCIFPFSLSRACSESPDTGHCLGVGPLCARNDGFRMQLLGSLG